MKERKISSSADLNLLKIDQICPRFLFTGLGSKSNDWVNVFPEFAQKIEGYIGPKTRAMIECDFSTTGVVERTVSQIVLMESVKAFFNYIVRCGCGNQISFFSFVFTPFLLPLCLTHTGIPFIQLTGTVQDWENIRSRTDQLRDFDLDWWIDDLNPVLDQLVAAAGGTNTHL